MSEEHPNRIKELRDARGWSLRELDEHSGITHTKLHRIETGATPADISDLRKIARALDVKISALLNDDDVEMRADNFAAGLLDIMKQIPSEVRADVIIAAHAVVRTARGIAAQHSSLEGNPNQVAQLAETWNRFRDAERGEALDLWKIAKLGRTT